MAEDLLERRSSMLKPRELSPSSCESDPEEKEVTDDDDDDRNHKHRRRETRSQSSDKDAPGPMFRRPSRKLNKPFESRAFFGNDPQSSDDRKEYNPAIMERDLSTKFERRRPILGSFPRAPFDSGPRTRLNQGFRGEPGHRFDLSSSHGRGPIGRGRGRSSGPWNQNDSKFATFDALDFASQMVPQGPSPSLFVSRGLQPFGLIPGMPNGGLDALHPLGMQGTLVPPINQTLNINLPRQRCRDFEERGFCLRGDMCPMEHGVNRIVVEDVQSLSQFNLPVSLPSAHLLGTTAGTGPLPSGAGSSSLTTSKPGHGKSSKAGIAVDAPGLNGMFSATGAAEADFYDPDQPLWNNNHPETSNALIGLSSPKLDDESLWIPDHSEQFDGENPGGAVPSAITSNASSSVWGRVGNSRNKLGKTGKVDINVSSLDCFEKETEPSQEEMVVRKRKHEQVGLEDVDAKDVNSVSIKPQSDPVRRPSQKALCTLFVNCIPLESNKREILFSHFRKFGEIIDIYIPVNSEKAFIQFSKREEAEAALKAPDAVMGNRFIKLWWANRDSIPVNGTSSGNTTSAVPHIVPTNSSATQLADADGGKDILDLKPPKCSAHSSSDVSVVAAVHPKPVSASVSKAIPSQKKLENLELLKEELRVKQEMLDQKRNDFRRLLNKLEKKASTVKGEAVELTVKRRKGELATDVTKATTPKSISTVMSFHHPLGEKSLDKTNLVENIVSSSPRSSTTVALQSPRNIKPPARPPAPLLTPILANRFKLDNRPTAFKILPPLPADFANVVTLREYFSSFGDLSTVELEDPDSDSIPANSEPSEKCSARITFRTRQSAERAFLNGKCWKGHNLQFSWLPSNKCSNEHNAKENFPIPTPTPTSTPILRDLPNTEVPAETATSGSSSSGIGKTTSSVSSAATCSGERDNCESSKDTVDPICASEDCNSGHEPLSSSETQEPDAGGLIGEDGLYNKSL
ncbi:hypothetical protein Sjap_023528 [Stephania japonica]|uniref:Zinc finger CCCH domain-containing protein 41 n=1 Tax=Stephania japonica TaxID=461633 RepID=A0AAP0EBR7_9MAGN